MGKLEDMALLVAVVEAGGLSAAGRHMGLSPATMTARLKAIEERYQTRLFHRSTRAITMTRAGEEFYHAALRVLDEMNHAESLLTQKEGVLSGNIRISALRFWPTVSQPGPARFFPAASGSEKLGIPGRKRQRSGSQSSGHEHSFRKPARQQPGRQKYPPES
jgi:hypothetical protein